MKNQEIVLDKKFFYTKGLIVSVLECMFIFNNV